jgi:hypothetical protein
LACQAQTEVFRAATLDASNNVVINEVFGTTANPVKDVTSGTENVVMHALTSGAPTPFIWDGTTVYDYRNWPSNAFQSATWTGNKLRIDSLDASGVNVGPYFPYVVGNGNPAIEFYGVAETKDDAPTGNYYVPSREYDGTGGGYVYYSPDGTRGVPVTGEYVELTPKKDGMFKVAFWANKGANRALYIIRKSTSKALDSASEYHAEGWVQGLTDTSGNMVYINPLPVANYAFSGLVADPKNNNAVTYEIGGRVKIGYLFFDGKAGETYMLIGNSWQFGFQGYEFTPGASTGITNVATVADDSNAPIYNLSGQRVSTSYKGVVISKGKKYLQK